MDFLREVSIPHEFTNLDEEENIELDKYFKGDLSKCIRVGLKKYLLPMDFIKEASNIFNLRLLPGDIIVAGYPRSGTTWAQELVWMIANDLDFHKAKQICSTTRFTFLEYTSFFNEKAQEKIRIKNLGNKENLQILEKLSMPGCKVLENRPSPRFIKTHLPLSLLPPSTLATAKFVYVARDPRDVAVSFYHQNKLFKFINFTGDFKTYWNLFMKDLILWSPYFENIKEAWNHRHHPNMLFLFYEDLKQDMENVIQRVSHFLDKKLSLEQVQELCDYLEFENFKNNPSVNRLEMKKMGIMHSDGSFIREAASCSWRGKVAEEECGVMSVLCWPAFEIQVSKRPWGKSGSWRDYFDEEMRLQAERWIEHNLRDTDFRFPHLNNFVSSRKVV